MTVCKASDNFTVVVARSQFILFIFYVLSFLPSCLSLPNRDFISPFSAVDKMQSIMSRRTPNDSDLWLRRFVVSEIEFDNLTSSILLHLLWDTRTKKLVSANEAFPERTVETLLHKNSPALRRFSRSSRRLKSQRRKKNRAKASGRIEPGFPNSLIGLRGFNPSKLLLANPLSTPSTAARLCPIWPTDPRIIVNCSNGRMLRSRCSVDCAPGFKFKTGTPGNRRCRMNLKIRRKKGFHDVQPTWSRKDEQFECVSACQPLQSPPNGKVMCTHDLVEGVVNAFTSRSCEVTCDPGFVPTHRTIRRCQTNGTWSGNDATCQAIPTKQRRPLFTSHHRLQCGDVYGLTTFLRHGSTYLVAGDVTGSRLRIYKWTNGQFQHWQVIPIRRPLMVEVIPRKHQSLWLMAGNEQGTSIFRINEFNKFVFFRSTEDLLMTKRGESKLNETEGFSLFGFNGNIYRCKGQKNKRGRSIVVVQKLMMRRDKRDVFKRVMRRKMKAGEKMFQCSMFEMNNKLHTLITVNKRDGQGKVFLGLSHKNRMKVVETLKDQELRRVSDATAFETSNKHQYIVVSQTSPKGHCFIYEKNQLVAEG